MTVNCRPEQKQHVNIEMTSSVPRRIPSPSHSQDSDILGLKPMVSSTRFSDMSHGFGVECM
jgi:hypothetical protein